MSKKTAVIGLGNTLRRDDGIGIIILESLLNFYKRKDIDYFDFGIASFDLINRINGYVAALLIDGIDAGLWPGEIKIFELKDIEYNQDAPVSSTHELDLKNLFDLVKSLEIKTRIYVAGIQVEDTSFGEGLSEGLENKKENIIKEIDRFIDKTF